jgi:methylmalonyl-CoA/ethylmalonyl-CoA epimerase
LIKIQNPIFRLFDFILLNLLPKAGISECALLALPTNHLSHRLQRGYPCFQLYCSVYNNNLNKNQKVMEISHIEHIGIAVPSLEEAIPFYEKILGLKCFAIEEVADQKVKTAFFKVGQTKIELLEGTADDSAISKFIANNGGRGGIQHVAFAVEDGVANALAEAEEKGCRLIDKAPRKGAEGLNIAFLHPKSTVGTLVELCEDPKAKA